MVTLYNSERSWFVSIFRCLWELETKKHKMNCVCINIAFTHAARLMDFRSCFTKTFGAVWRMSHAGTRDGFHFFFWTVPCLHQNLSIFKKAQIMTFLFFSVISPYAEEFCNIYVVTLAVHTQSWLEWDVFVKSWCEATSVFLSLSLSVHSCNNC